MRCAASAAVVLLWVGQVVGAGGEEPVRLALADAVALASWDSPVLDRARALEDLTAAIERGVRAERKPYVDVLAGVTRTSDVPELTLALPGEGSRTLFPNIPTSYRARIETGIPVYTGGRLTALVDSAALLTDAASWDTDAVAKDLVLETCAAYWALRAAREAEAVLRRTLESYEQHLRDAANRRDLGLAAPDELLAVRVERDEAELHRLKAERAASTAEENLRRLTGLSPGRGIDPIEPFESAPSPPGDVDVLVTEALGARPERSSLEARRLSALARARGEKAGSRPQVTFVAGYDYSDPNREVLPVENGWQDTWDVSLIGGWRVFDGGKAAAGEARATADAAILEARIDELDRAVRLEVVSRVNDLRTARASVRVSEGAVDAARENARVTRDRHREGAAPSSDLLDAETRLLLAELRLTEARAAVEIARAGLDRALGR